MLPSSTPTLSFAPAPCPAALWLVRHGESTWNVQGLVQGHNDDAELTARGAEQAATLAERFAGAGVGAVYASDLRRALQTANVVAKVAGVPVITDARLRERNLGVLEGTAHATVTPSVTGIDAGQVLDPDARPQGGESVRDLYLRAAAFCDDLAGWLEDRAGEVVVVAHGGTLRVLRAYLSGVPVEQMCWEPLENARVLRIEGFGSYSRGGTE
jgi:2,3-bisphosphoglycerate-dependent phosphoglycerate mutase